MNKLIAPRIVAGKFKNYKLEVNEVSRPITERVKIILFDTISELIENAAVLDLFAGSGNLGIESLSRGAKLAIFIESNTEAFEVLKNNLRKLELDKSSHKIFNLDYLEFAKQYDGNFDIIFLDPPFKLQSRLNIENIAHLLSKDGVIVYKIEDAQKEDIKISGKFEIILEKKVGINTLLFIKLKSA